MRALFFALAFLGFISAGLAGCSLELETVTYRDVAIQQDGAVRRDASDIVVPNDVVPPDGVMGTDATDDRIVFVDVPHSEVIQLDGVGADGFAGDARPDIVVGSDIIDVIIASDGGLCPTGSALCTSSDICTDLQNDVHHCGSCSHDCAPASATDIAANCFGGSCVTSPCSLRTRSCDNDPTNGCETDLGSNAHCGSCDVACDISSICTQIAANSFACVSTCRSPMPDACGNHCVDLTSDPQNCGSCGHACPSVSGGSSSCLNSQCQALCAVGLIACGGQCFAATCGASNPCMSGTVTCLDDVVSCLTAVSAAGTNCGTNHECDLSGQCSACGGAGAPCCTLSACRNGSVCSLGSGAALCTCLNGSTACGDACVNLASDNANCGSCRHPCSATQQCVAGVCTSG